MMRFQGSKGDIHGQPAVNKRSVAQLAVGVSTPTLYATRIKARTRVGSAGLDIESPGYGDLDRSRSVRGGAVSEAAFCVVTPAGYRSALVATGVPFTHGKEAVRSTYLDWGLGHRQSGGTELIVVIVSPAIY